MSSLDLSILLKMPKLPDYIEQVDQQLAKTIATSNPYIHKPVSRLLKYSGKRLRPSLVIAVAVSGDHQIDQNIIAGSMAVELVHLGSLVHDDIIDKADNRRNVETVNAKEGINSAIVVGDYLLSKAVSIATEISPTATHLIASTIASLCEGESWELSDQHNIERSVQSLTSAINGKTAALISAACQMGGLCGGLDEMSIGVLAAYGTAFGSAFQLIDDLLDFLGASNLIGKPIGNDLKEGIYTLPILLSLKGSSADVVKSWIDPSSTASRRDIATTLLENGSIEETIMEIKKHNKLATSVLDNISDSPIKATLEDLPDSYLKWALYELTAESYRPALGQFLQTSD